MKELAIAAETLFVLFLQQVAADVTLLQPIILKEYPVQCNMPKSGYCFLMYSLISGGLIFDIMQYPGTFILCYKKGLGINQAKEFSFALSKDHFIFQDSAGKTRESDDKMLSKMTNPALVKGLRQ